MKKIAIITTALTISLSSCQNANQNKDQMYAEQAIAIHDEIMPQISTFDKTTLVIDSLLTNISALASQHVDLDTVQTKVELTQLKDSLNDATDHMMMWMKDYDPANQEETYQKQELDKITDMKGKFDRAQQQISKTLAPFN
ncbi:MAG: transposase [Sphingobacterium sp.]